ncbi:MAG: dolichyl-phosphate beta-glucosyltransferase [Armatimonadota bacterium]
MLQSSLLHGHRLSVVIPAYNEQTRLHSTLPEMWDYFMASGSDFEIIIVSDGSSDGTAALVRSFAVEHPQVRLIDYTPNHGKGYAVRTGMLEARGDIVMFMDADLATPLDETANLLPYIVNNQADVVIASRACRGAKLEKRQPWYREMAGRCFNLIVQALAVPGIVDTQCGFKIFTKKASAQVFSRCQEDGFAFDIEAIVVARRLGFGVKEVGVKWHHVEGSKVSLFRDANQMFRKLIQIRQRHKSLNKSLYESS